MEVTVCIATHHDPAGLYLSVFAALQQLEKSNLDWEIVISADGGDPCKWEQAHPNIRCIRLTGSNSTGSPQGTRDVGIRAAKYRNVLCIDSHVIVSDIEKLVREHIRLGGATSFPATAGCSSEFWKLYGWTFDWDGSFWYKRVVSQPKSQEPYRIIGSSHSGFIVDRDFYVSSGGYTNLQIGYGGEETFWALKCWMLGRENFLIPSVTHAHYQPAGRNEGASSTDNYKRNFLVAAYVMGGTEYLKKAEAHYTHKLYVIPDIQNERLRIRAGPYNGNLDLLREYCRKEGIE